MSRIQENRSGFFCFLVLCFALVPAVNAKTNDDEHIREIVASLLKEKDRKIEQLEARIKQLEQGNQVKQVAVEEPARQTKNAVAESDTPQPKPVVDAAAKTVASSGNDATVSGKLKDLTKKVDELKATAEANGLNISGFFDINAKTGNPTDQTFSVGSVELDLDYAHDEHFGASTALVLCGDSSGAGSDAPAHIYCGGSGPGGLGGGSAGFAAALVDYHLFSDRIPPRGRIFNNQGLHIQVGRFDLPFGTDYQNFANKDRVTITAPLTTSRMQLGGYNADGLRSYGSWNMFNYSVFWTDAIYANDGHAIGGRLGMSLGQNAYTVHHNKPDAIQEGIEFGVSHLSELNGSNNIRNTVYGADLSIGYGMLRLQNELMLLQAHQDDFLDADGNIALTTTDTPFGRSRQLGYHATLIADLERFINYPLRAFARYGRWQPSQRLGLDFDRSTVAVNNISMLSLGLNYQFSEHLRIKFEYNDSLGTEIAERYFSKKLGIAQLVMSF
ncbi:MAG: hypothetical protein EPN17_13170 [Methylobacter sp.]|nr:MAG: hypothetical protein EPN17_13170 [Methylobacter sp.]